MNPVTCGSDSVRSTVTSLPCLVTRARITMLVLPKPSSSSTASPWYTPSVQPETMCARVTFGGVEHRLDRFRQRLGAEFRDHRCSVAARPGAPRRSAPPGRRGSRADGGRSAPASPAGPRAARRSRSGASAAGAGPHARSRWRRGYRRHAWRRRYRNDARGPPTRTSVDRRRRPARTPSGPADASRRDTDRSADTHRPAPGSGTAPPTPSRPRAWRRHAPGYDPPVPSAGTARSISAMEKSRDEFRICE